MTIAHHIVTRAQKEFQILAKSQIVGVRLCYLYSPKNENTTLAIALQGAYLLTQSLNFIQ